MARTNTTIVFVHGDGGPSAESWRLSLDHALAAAGLPQIRNADDVRIVEPRYDDVLIDPAPAGSLERAKRNLEGKDDVRYEYELRKDDIYRSLTPLLSSGGDGLSFVPDIDLVQALGLELFNHVKQFSGSSAARRRAIARVLAAAPPSGRVVLIGHSLGSVVALASLSRFPERVHVPVFLTVGSPLGMDLFVKHVKMEGTTHFPVERVDLWANAYGTRDQITRARGIASTYPFALDLRLQPYVTHSAADYMGHPAVARLVGDAVFGRRAPSTEIARAESADLARQVNPALVPLVVMFRWLHAWQTWCATHERSKQAVRLAAVIDLLARDIQERYDSIEAPDSVDLPPLPDLRRAAALDLGACSLNERDLLAQLVYLSAERVEAPYAVGEHTGASRSHCRTTLWTEASPGSAGKRDAKAADEAVGKAIREAKELFDDGGSWWPLLAGAGLVVLAATGVGLALAVPAGLAGAAAITATLAAFGPGGMIGGIATLAALTGAGSAMVASATALGSSGSTVEAARDAERRAALAQVLALPRRQFRSALISVLATARAYQLFELDNPGGQTWLTLTELESQCARAVARHRLGDVDDKSSPLRDWQGKSEDVQVGLRWLQRMGMAPQQIELPAG
jgi:pimeloyl-ACP methyl ester carboxylesterase